MTTVEEDSTSLFCFFIFNINAPKEGEEPILYWFYPDTESHYLKIEMVSLAITFIRFVKRFNPSEECDYVSTNLREVSYLHLIGPIWMAVVINSRASYNRYVLHNVLVDCRELFSLFWVNIQSTVPPPLDTVISALDPAFSCIVKEIQWEQLDFMALFHSCINQPLGGNYRTLSSICRSILDQHPQYLSNIAVFTRKRRIVYSTFPPAITRALAFSVRKSFTHLFPQYPSIDWGHMSWLIGLYKNKYDILSVYQPIVYMNDNKYILTAFKYRMFKIVLTLRTDIEINEDLFLLLPTFLKPLKKYLSENSPRRVMTEVPISFIFVEDHPTEERMDFGSNQINTITQPVINHDIMHIHFIAMQSQPLFGRYLMPKHQNSWIYAKWREGPARLGLLNKAIDPEVEPINCDTIERVLYYQVDGNISIAAKAVVRIIQTKQAMESGMNQQQCLLV